MKSIGSDTNAYYRYHAKIYDWTRWAFLFGRRQMVHEILALQPKKVLEVGCGTGQNLIEIKNKAPHIECIGIDASRDMLHVAKQKSPQLGIHWLTGTYPSESCDQYFKTCSPPDVILFSYALSMFNPGWDLCLEAAHHQVPKNGHVCLVDFHHSEHNWFKHWMLMNHVRMDKHLLGKIESLGQPQKSELVSAPLGLWSWVMAISCPQNNN